MRNKNVVRLDFININGAGQPVRRDKRVKQQRFATGEYGETRMSIVSKFHGFGFTMRVK
jgi:hypothetical protein